VKLEVKDKSAICPRSGCESRKLTGLVKWLPTLSID
jgi:hypothetical protein